MELPITPKFFKKLELYQDLKRLDKRNVNHKEWDMEKDLLFWAHVNHFHLGTYLDTGEVLEKLKTLDKYSLDELNEHTFKMMQNLEEHGWAEWWPQRGQKNAIKINKEGMLLSEVVNEIINKNRDSVYKFLILISWITIIAGVIIIISNAIRVVINLFTN